MAPCSPVSGSIAVSDWDVSNAFYRDVVGAELVPGGPGRMAYRLGDTQLNVHVCWRPA